MALDADVAAELRDVAAATDAEVKVPAAVEHADTHAEARLAAEAERLAEALEETEAV